ncbi:MAG: hypothetical protein U0Q07_01185 [Acidimicrobiales bacterium]
MTTTPDEGTTAAPPTTALAPPAPATLVDLERYPITDRDSAAYAAVVAAARAELAATGAAELSGFLSPAGLDAALADAVAVEASAHRSEGPATAYLDWPDLDQPDGHPRRWLGQAAVGAVAWDLFPAASPIRALYEWELLRAFVEDVLDRGALFRYADPLGGLNLATMGAGDQLQWHFDQTDFVVSLAVRDADDGGDFEVVPRVRSAHDERYEAVGAVLDGDTSDVVTLPMTPGTLLVFEGRHSLHRVSPINGDTTRLVALFGYDTKPGTMSSDLLKQIRYGRTEPVAPATTAP